MVSQSHISTVSLGVMLVVSGSFQPARAAETVSGDAARFEAARQLTIDWIQTRETINRTLRDWSDQRQSLELTSELLETELTTLDNRIAAIQAESAKDRKRRDELERKLKERNGLIEYTAGRLANMEARLVAMSGRFPIVLQEKVRPLTRKFPSPDAPSQIPVSQRLQNLLTVFNEIEKFNAQFTVTPEMHSLNGAQVRVQVLYLGLAQAYYVSPTGRFAGVGRPGPDGWIWTANNAIGDRVKQAIEVSRDETAPTLVNLPFELQ
ncbi:MAG: DUF3450 family protein [Verrucomicrobiae bacterium]|jgi:hypothetical protein|nr:DUF3450 family protein [Verrucomicrobiae bacterium]